MSSPASDPDQREALREILKQRGILYASDTQQIRHRNGALAPWAFYSWNATLTSDGLRLAALNLLELLNSYRSTQLASYGYTGAPLLAACVLMGAGRYTGANIRERRKAYLSGRRIEGPFDPRRPVIIIDDSLSSGTSLHEAILAVEQEGGEVEGAVALVNFPFRGGFEWANAAGYRTETVFDIWTDLEMARTLESPERVHARPFATASQRAPDGLAPAVLARRAAEFYLNRNAVLGAPTRMDASYDGRGGVFVSFRQRHTDARLARDGFWHFDARNADPNGDVIAATVDTIRTSNGAVSLANLAELKIAVTFFGPLERILPCGLDFSRYGIVVQSRVFPSKRGGALPNTQVFISEIEQYRQARWTNAQIDKAEPHDLYRHDLVKCVEPGEEWLPYGCPEGPETNWWRDRTRGELLTERALALLDSSSAAPLPADLVPGRIAGIAVKFYRRGLVGYGLELGHDVDRCLRAAVQTAKREHRFAQQESNSPSDGLAVTVAVLHHPEWLDDAPLAVVVKKMRRGLDAVSVTKDGRTTVFLPSAVPYNNWTREQFVSALLQHARVEPPCLWNTYQSAEWVRCGTGVFPLRFGFCERHPSEYDLESCRRDIRLLASYVYNSVGADALPCYHLAPLTGETQHAGTAARAIHGLMALDAAGRLLGEQKWQAAAVRGYRMCLSHLDKGSLALPGRTGGALADCVLLAGIAQSAEGLESWALTQRVHRLFRADGRISDFAKRVDFEDDQDYLPGSALWAVAQAGYVPSTAGDHLQFYRRRFRAVPSWGMAGWQPQGWQALYTHSRDREHALFAFEVADWAIDRQVKATGAFLEDLSPDEPSFNTGFIAEGIAAAWRLAVEEGDGIRAACYQESWWAAARFLTRLIIYPEDIFAMPEPERAIGGVRCMQSRSDVRIDQVSHCLHALVEGANLLQTRKV